MWSYTEEENNWLTKTIKYFEKAGADRAEKELRKYHSFYSPIQPLNFNRKEIR